MPSTVRDRRNSRFRASTTCLSVEVCSTPTCSQQRVWIMATAATWNMAKAATYHSPCAGERATEGAAGGVPSRNQHKAALRSLLLRVSLTRNSITIQCTSRRSQLNHPARSFAASSMKTAQQNSPSARRGEKNDRTVRFMHVHQLADAPEGHSASPP